MKRFAVCASIALAWALSSAPSTAAPGEQRTLQGMVVWSPGAGGEPFVIVQADDGRSYVVDVSTAQRRAAVNPGERVAMVAVEGPRPFDLIASVIGVAEPPPSGAVIPPAPASASPSASPPTASGPPPPPAPAERSWRRIDGRIERLVDSTLRLRDEGGRTHAVDVSQLSTNVVGTLRPGDAVTVFAIPEGRDHLVAVGFVRMDPPAGAAAPRR